MHARSVGGYRHGIGFYVSGASHAAGSCDACSCKSPANTTNSAKRFKDAKTCRDVADDPIAVAPVRMLGCETHKRNTMNQAKPNPCPSSDPPNPGSTWSCLPEYCSAESRDVNPHSSTVSWAPHPEPATRGKPRGPRLYSKRVVESLVHQPETCKEMQRVKHQQPPD